VDRNNWREGLDGLCDRGHIQPHSVSASATAPKNTSRDVQTQPAYQPKFTSLIVYNTFHSIIFNIPFPGTIARDSIIIIAMNTDVADVLDRIGAMRFHEEGTARAVDYLTSNVDAKCRKLMVDWCFTVVDAFNLSREAVGVAVSILDRYLSSGKGDATNTLQCKQKFQLASVTCFYMSVKVHESAQFGVHLITQLCRGLYKESEIISMEQDILCAIEWRLYASSTTPMEFVRQYLELLKDHMDDTSLIQKSAARHMDIATSDISYSTWRSSSIGMACLAGAFDDDCCMLSTSKKDDLWHQLLEKLESYLDLDEINIVELKLLSAPTTFKSLQQSIVRLPRSSLLSATSESTSPVSVFQGS
jgi:hypothetical protein